MNFFKTAWNHTSNFVDASFQVAGHTILNLGEIKNHPDVFQKILQVAYSWIQGLDYVYGGNRLPKVFCSFMNTSGMHDFLGIFRTPYNVIYKVRAQNINPEVLTISLTNVFKKQITDFSKPIVAYDEACNEAMRLSRLVANEKEAQELPEGKDDKEVVEKLDSLIQNKENAKDKAKSLLPAKYAAKKQAKELAEKYVKEHLLAMNHSDEKAKNMMPVGYTTFGSFKMGLQERINESFKKKELERSVDLSNLDNEQVIKTDKTEKNELIYKKDPIISRLSSAAFSICDVLCVPTYLDMWKVDTGFISGTNKLISFLGLSSISTKLGASKAGQWAKNQDLGKLAWGTVGVAYGLSAGEYARKLADDHLSQEQKGKTQWNLAASIAETVFSIANFVKVQDKYIIGLRIFTKSVGILNTTIQGSTIQKKKIKVIK